MIPAQYVWLAWASAFLVPWAGLFLFFPRYRHAMWWASVFTTPFGLTEPLFVPEYWNPPSLFDLAQRTGFDLESLIFCFAIGGIGAVSYDALFRVRLAPLPVAARSHPRHRLHHLALASPFLIFLALVFLPWNPIYPGIVAMFVGGLATILCRPDLKTRTWVGALLFLAIYIVFLQSLRLFQPGYIEEVWNHSALTGVGLLGMPVEELLFASGFGLYWAGVYEHYTWQGSHRYSRLDSSAPLSA